MTGWSASTMQAAVTLDEPPRAVGQTEHAGPDEADATGRDQMTTLVIPPREGKAVSMGGFGAIYKISGDSSEGRFSIIEHPIDPGRMVYPHVHAHEDEFSYILEGEIGARIGDEVLQAATGSYVFKPRAYHTRSGTRPRSLPDCSNSSRPQALKVISSNWPTCCGPAATSTR